MPESPRSRKSPFSASFSESAKRSIYLEPSALERECRSERLRRSGPGGQNRNKVETAVRFYHLPTGLVGEATERRYQAENRKIALARLRIEIALNVRDLARVFVSTSGSDATPGEITLPTLKNAASFRWFERLIAGKIRVSPSSFDYPILVSEFFDVYFGVGENLGATAALLETSSSQIVRFLAEIPKCLDALNRLRALRGLGRLRV